MASKEFVEWLRYDNKVQYMYEYGIICKEEYDEVRMTYSEWCVDKDKKEKDLTDVV